MNGDDAATDSGEPAPLDPVALSVAAATATGALGSPGLQREVGVARPWTAAAAMEPIPPLAPPPARPGSGTPVAMSPRPAVRAAGARPLVSLIVLLIAAAVVIVLVVVLGH